MSIQFLKLNIIKPKLKYTYYKKTNKVLTNILLYDNIDL
jgi:hypothetical protein